MRAPKPLHFTDDDTGALHMRFRVLPPAVRGNRFLFASETSNGEIKYSRKEAERLWRWLSKLLQARP